MFDLDGIAPKIRALYNTFLNWDVTDADAALAAINTNLDAPISGISTGGKRRAVKLTSADGSSWTHPENIKDDFVLVTLVGGGGAGGRDSTAGEGGAGGGGGEVLLRVPYILSGSSTVISVAAAKAGRATDGKGDDGDDTDFGTLTAEGGVGGGSSATGSPPPAGAGGGVYGGSGSGLQASNGAQLGWRIGGGEGGNGDDASGGAPQAGGHGISSGGAADAANNCGGGGGSWGVGGPGLTGGGSGCNGTDGGGGGGCRSGTSGAGGAGFIIVEWEEADSSGGGGGAGSDTDAVHVNVAGEISGITEKTSVAVGDWLLIEDSADSDAKKAVKIGTLFGLAQVNVQSGTSYTIQTSDAGKVVVFTNGSSIDVTLPDTLDDYFQFTVVQAGAGVPTVTRSGSDTINGAATGVTPSAQWKGAYFCQYSSGAWLALL